MLNLPKPKWSPLPSTADIAERDSTDAAREEGRQEERGRVVARLERLCREAPTDPIGFACHFAIAVQDIRSGKGT